MRSPLEVLGYHALRRTVRMPRALADRLFGEPPTNDRGAPLDGQLHVLLEIIERTGQPELHELGAREAREVYAMSNRLFDFEPRPLWDVEDRPLPGGAGAVGVRIYRPDQRRDLPACVYLHGGGFVIGGLDGYDGLCRQLAARCECVIISVDYRLAPEHPFPAAVEDCVQVFRWVRAWAKQLGVDPNRLAIAGDSAGGNLATVVCQQLVERGEAPPTHQVLIYPATDERGGYASLEHFEEGFFLSTAMIDWFTDTYTAGRDCSEDPRFSPILYERLDQLPPATVVTAGFDPLRDEGEAYASHLREAGVEVSHRCCEHLVHGFITMGGLIDAAAEGIEDIAADLRRALG